MLKIEKNEFKFKFESGFIYNFNICKYCNILHLL